MQLATGHVLQQLPHLLRRAPKTRFLKVPRAEGQLVRKIREPLLRLVWVGIRVNGCFFGELGLKCGEVPDAEGEFSSIDLVHEIPKAPQPMG
jgi:hypothetical protein